VRHTTIIAMVFAGAAPCAAAAQGPDAAIRLRAGMTIDRSVTIAPGRYDLPASGDSVPVIRVRGSDVVVDFAGAELVGAPDDAPPDARRGIAVQVDSGARIAIRRARIRGYKVAILARGTRGLTLESNDVGGNWKPRLHSGPRQESLADWLSYHRNEANEWLRYGAGIYLDGVADGEVRGNRASGGMNGIMLARSTGVRVWNNALSHMSGVCIALYRASRNVIMHNRADWCVRGYSHGFYARGQDSAALLMYEQSSGNVVAYNSMTHGGDGLFLWAGQHTMDTGEGGSNDNLFYGNDFSHAPTNAMEATFSRNRFVNNRAEESAHGLWGGYSFESLVLGNRFARNRVGVAIEHGQDDRVERNVFDGDTTAIRLWWNRIEPGDWGYPKHRDTRSRDWIVRGNRFEGNRVALRAEHTQRVRLEGNRFVAVDTQVVAVGDTSGFSREDGGSAAGAEPAPWTPRGSDTAVTRHAPPPIDGAIDAMLPAGTRRGRATIVVDEWGPYDWRAPKLWPALDSANLDVFEGRTGGSMRLVVLGPAGTWRLARAEGARVDRRAGRTGDTLVVTPAPGRVRDVSLAFSAEGGAEFHWRHALVRPDWRVRVFAWDSTADPRADTAGGAAAWMRITRRAPLLERAEPRLDWTWYRPRVAGVPLERFAVVATATVEIPRRGRWLLRTISDDAVRVRVDGRTVIDRWTPHESAVDTAALAPGRREIVVEYYQVDGWTELRAEIVGAENERARR
jgi:parallel beta-helix repeat protein